MSASRWFSQTRKCGAVLASAVLLGFLIWHFTVYGQDRSNFPDGFDAVQAAPQSHKMIFENALVRVLEVTVPPPGTTEPMHHHCWPSFFLAWDTGGKTPHVRYLRPGGTVRDEPSVTEPVRPGKRSIGGMKPEPMHAIQTVDRPEKTPTIRLCWRVEVKCLP